jgi:hypothetical protein
MSLPSIPNSTRRFAAITGVALILTTTLLAARDEPKKSKATLADLSWFAGHWRSDDKGRTVEEVWLPSRGATLIGMKPNDGGERRRVRVPAHRPTRRPDCVSRQPRRQVPTDRVRPEVLGGQGGRIREPGKRLPQVDPVRAQGRHDDRLDPRRQRPIDVVDLEARELARLTVRGPRRVNATRSI